jgi:hypothetical protein
VPNFKRMESACNHLRGQGCLLWWGGFASFPILQGANSPNQPKGTQLIAPNPVSQQSLTVVTEPLVGCP